MGLILLVLFIGLPIAELYVIIQVGQAIGILPTLALLIADSILGAVLLRSQGRAAWARFNTAIAEGRVPASEVFDGAMVILGGALLLTPGFITDAFGLFLLFPPTRALARRGVAAMAKRRVRFATVFTNIPSPGSRRPPPPGGTPHSRTRSYDFEGTATEVEEYDELPKGRRDGG